MHSASTSRSIAKGGNSSFEKRQMKKEDLTLACAAADLQLDIQLLEQVGEGGFKITGKLAAGTNLV
jgi:hypothetical protein